MPKKPQIVSGPGDLILTLGKELFKAKAEKEKLEEALSAINERIKQLATVDLAKLMEDAGVEKQTIKGLGTIYLGSDFYASVLKEDRPKLYDWMREHGHGDIVQDYVFPQTLTAFMREQLGANNPVPEFVKATHIPVAKTRRT